LIQQINQERSGELVDPGILKKVVDVYQWLEDERDASLKPYELDFQVPFLESSRHYFAEKAIMWMMENDIPTYLEKVEKATLGEENRVQSYMKEATQAPLIAVVVDVLLKQQMDRLLNDPQSGLRTLLRNDKLEDLARMYRLFSRIPVEGGKPSPLEPMAKILQAHLIDLGASIVGSRLPGAGGSGEGGGGGGGGPRGGGGGF